MTEPRRRLHLLIDDAIDSIGGVPRTISSRGAHLISEYFTESDMNSYILLNNREASKYDLYLPGRLVAALHYNLVPAENTMMFVYCEAIEKTEANRHCRELMRQATEHARNRRLELTIPCPIARRALQEALAEVMSTDDLVPDER
ncbi:hypothetical protein ACSBQT_03530 [Brevibacterium sp. H602]|uniref:hypothetical protein n=1 Tax=unclassified Brevibacterium TaxID=2614124 RepID=UPI003DA9C394